MSAKMKFKQRRPSRDKLWGMSPSQFKTMLKRRGHRVCRDFFGKGSISKHKGRLFRFRWWGSVGEFFVDVSCPVKDFDRWANSTDCTLTFYDWVKGVAEKVAASRIGLLDGSNKVYSEDEWAKIRADKIDKKSIFQ
jgi:hypothetical protein